MSRAGRTRSLENTELITLDECLKRLQDLWSLNEPPYKRRTLQNKISRGEFKRYGPFHIPLVDWNEVRNKELRKHCG